MTMANISSKHNFHVNARIHIYHLSFDNVFGWPQIIIHNGNQESKTQTWKFYPSNSSVDYKEASRTRIFYLGQFFQKINFFQSNRGGEFASTAFQNQLQRNSIVHQLSSDSSPQTPEQNGWGFKTKTSYYKGVGFNDVISPWYVQKILDESFFYNIFSI
jgi:hypothetical protein